LEHLEKGGPREEKFKESFNMKESSLKKKNKGGEVEKQSAKTVGKRKL